MEQLSSETPVIDLVASVPLLIVGSGRAALHVASRLPTALHEDVMVVDPSGTWLADFTQRMSKHEVELIRSPVTQVPFINVLGLQKYAENNMRVKSDCISSSAKFLPLPTTRLFLEYMAHEIPRVLGGIRIKKDLVTDLKPVDAAELERLQIPSGIRVHFASGGSLVAHQVVYCGDSAVPNVPSCIQPHITHPPKGMLPDRLALAHDVDVRAVSVQGEVVMVMGGGMTACQLACAALDHGAAQVILVSRKTFKKREFEVEVAYFGNKGLYEFRRTEEPRKRLQLCIAARGQATINRITWKRIQAYFKEGRLDIQQECEITNVVWDGGQWRVSIKSKDESDKTPASVHPPGPTEVSPAQAPALATGGMDDIDSDNEQDNSHPASNTDLDDISAYDPNATIADRIWVATGSRVDLKKDPLLSKLMGTDPVRCIGGFPVLEDKSLRWPGLPLYFIGGYTMLSLGPMARLMPGYRYAADRLTEALKRDALTALCGENPYSLPSGSIPIEAFDDDDVPFEEVQEEYVQEQIEKAMGPKPTLKNREVINMDKIPEHLPRKILENYSWMQSDDDMHVHVILPIEEPVDRNCVMARFRKRSVEIWVVCEQAAYRFYIQNLYKDVLEEQCYFKVSQRSQRVTLVLKKYETNPWRFLRS